MKRAKELVKNTAIISLGKLSTQLISFLLLPFYTSKLLPEEYGNFDFITSIAIFAVPLITMLLEESMFRFLIDADTENKKRQIISLTFIYSVFSLIILSVLFGLIFYLLNYELGFYIIIYMISTVFISLSNALSRGNGKIGLYSFSNFLASFLTIISNIILILNFKLGFSALIYSAVFANLISSFLILIKLKIWKLISIKDFKLNKLKEMLAYSLPLVPNTICWSVINTSDRLIIVSFLGSSANGIYSIAYKFPNLINTLYSFFNIAWRESSAKMLKDESYQSEYNIIYLKIKKMIFSVTIMLISIIPFVFSLFIDSAYISGLLYIPILAIATYYACLSGFYGGIFTAFKDTKILGITSFLGASVNLIVNLLCVKSFGLFAAAISTLISSYIMYLYRKIKSKKYIKFDKKGNISYLIWFIVLCLIYYIDVLWLSIIMLVINLVISINLNKDILLFVKKFGCKFFKKGNKCQKVK